MTREVEIALSEIRPKERGVLEALGAPASTEVMDRWRPQLDRAFDFFDCDAKPRAVWKSISIERFAGVYSGVGENAPDTPLASIFPAADVLKLFVLTLGQAITDRIAGLQREADFATATILDSVASRAADCAVNFLERRMEDELEAGGGDSLVLAYSPGYCGWHVSGQQTLFDCLQPEEIGVRLQPSMLMLPVKTVSGVLAAGPYDMHDFEIGFGFCSRCATFECRDRLERLRGVAHGRRGGG